MSRLRLLELTTALSELIFISDDIIEYGDSNFTIEELEDIDDLVTNKMMPLLHNPSILFRLRSLDKEIIEDQYLQLLELLKFHKLEVVKRVMAGRRAGLGNFGYFTKTFDNQCKVMKQFQIMLWRLSSIINGSQSGKCYLCDYMTHNFHFHQEPEHWCNAEQEGWKCQYECEHK